MQEENNPPSKALRVGLLVYTKQEYIRLLLDVYLWVFLCVLILCRDVAGVK